MKNSLPSFCYLKQILFFITLGIFTPLGQPVAAQVLAQYKSVATKIISTATADSSLYERLAVLCDTYGSRLSGSTSLEEAIDWILTQAGNDGYEARGERVLVPVWVRGDESLMMTKPRTKPMALLGLGGSIATPSEGIRAEVMVVSSFEELKSRSSEVRSKIVLFNVPFSEYGKTVQYRVRGAIEAARYGAVASLVRSITPYSINTPHTGAMQYNDSIPKIPHAAITIEDAELIRRITTRGQKVEVNLKMQATTLPDAESRNVVFELKGREKPNEIVVMGGHLDSWEVGQGAMDDAGGAFAAWHALNVIRALGLQPKRTIRVVMWTNEENGLRGGKAYAELHADEKHVLALESDEGTFKPLGFHFDGSKDMRLWLQTVMPLMEPLKATQLEDGFGGADVGPLKEKFGTPLLGLVVDATRYFWYHHTHGDTMDKLNPRELNECAAVLAIMAFVAADSDALPISNAK